jgi:hypothetical protein
MRTVVSHSNDPHTPSAIEEIIEHARGQLAGERPKGGLMFTWIQADHAHIVERIQAEWPDLPLIGCTTDGELSSQLAFQEDSICLMLFVGNELEVVTTVARDVSRDPFAAVKSSIEASLLPDAAPQLCIILPDGLSVSGAQLVDAFSASLPAGVPLVGGTAGDQWEMRRTVQYYGGEVLSDSAPAMLLYGDFRVGVGVYSGWTPMGHTFVVEASSGPTVERVSGRTCLDLYRRTLGEHVPITPEYPMQLRSPDGMSCLRAPLAFNEQSGTVTFAGDVPVGTEIQLAGSSPTDMLKACRESVERATRTVPDASVAIIFSCAGRRELLGTRAGEEYTAIVDCLPPGTSIIGFYSYGEIAPPEPGASVFFHNETFVTVLLGSA